METIQSFISALFSEKNKISMQNEDLIFLELGFPCGSAGKESTCNAEDLGSIPGLG